MIVAINPKERTNRELCWPWTAQRVLRAQHQSADGRPSSRKDAWQIVPNWSIRIRVKQASVPIARSDLRHLSVDRVSAMKLISEPVGDVAQPRSTEYSSLRFHQFAPDWWIEDYIGVKGLRGLNIIKLIQ